MDYARRARPSLAYASIGNGSQHHLAMEMLRAPTKLDMVHVPYKGGGPATLALISGEVAAMSGGNSVASQIKAGKLRAIAVAGKQRMAAYPDVAALGEVFPGIDVTPWLGIFAPTGVPAPALTRLRTEVGRWLADAGTVVKLRGLGGFQPFVTTPEEFAAFVRNEHAKYGQVVKAVGVKVD